MLYGTEALGRLLDLLFPHPVIVHNHRSQQNNQLGLGGRLACVAEHRVRGTFVPAVCTSADPNYYS